MSRPSKPVAVLDFEKKSHRTKRELAQREAAENALLTGVRLREQPGVKADPMAHKEFMRLRALLERIGKDDALYQGVLNRYCMLYAECARMEEKQEAFYASAQKLETRFYEGGSGLEEGEFLKLLLKLQGSVVACDRQLQAKRKMLLDIEKENIMTIASALRSVPKAPAEDGEDSAFEALIQKQLEVRQRIAAAGGR